MSALLLASASPRRLALLQAAGFAPQVLPAHSEEIWPGGAATAAAVALARDKLAAALAQHGAQAAADAAWLAADTVVLCDGEVLGKPADDADAKRMLLLLSGRPHQVITGFVAQRAGAQRAAAVVTQVCFRRLTAGEVARYLACGEGRGKAGSYAIQGQGHALIDTVQGSLTNVVGLPVREVLAALEALGVAPLAHG